MAAKYNITIDQGSDYALALDLTQDGVALTNLTGYAVRGQIRATYYSTTYNSFTGTVVDDATGRFKISLAASVSAAMAPGIYYYDVEIYKDTYVTRLLQGTVCIVPEVTR